MTRIVMLGSVAIKVKELEWEDVGLVEGTVLYALDYGVYDFSKSREGFTVYLDDEVLSESVGSIEEAKQIANNHRSDYILSQIVGY